VWGEEEIKGGRDKGMEGGLALQQGVHAVEPTQLAQASLVLRVRRQQDGEQLGAVSLRRGKGEPARGREGEREGEREGGRESREKNQRGRRRKTARKERGEGGAGVRHVP